MEEMCVHSKGAGMHTLEETLLVVTKELWWQVGFFSLLPPPPRPRRRLDDNLISAKFLCVLHLSFSIPFSLTSPISIPLHTASPSLQPRLQPPYSSIPPQPPTISGGAGTLVHLILSLRES